MNRAIRNCLLSALPLLVAGCATTTPPVAELPMSEDPSASPMVGEWQWSVSALNCVETLTYRADGTYQSTSRDEVMTGRYQISAEPNENGRYQVIWFGETDNGGVDCGKRSADDVGRSSTRWLSFTDDGAAFVSYADGTTGKGTGPFYRTDGPAAGGAVEAAAEPAVLAFGWPTDARARITQTSVRKGRSFTLSYDMTVTQSPDTGNLTIAFSNYEFDKDTPADVAQLLRASSMANMPSLVIAPSGELVDLTGLTEWMERMVAVWGDQGVTGEKVQAMLQSEVVQRAMINELLEMWSLWVESWTELALGAGEQLAGEVPMEYDGHTLMQQVTVSNMDRPAARGNDTTLRMTINMGGKELAGLAGEIMGELLASIDFSADQVPQVEGMEQTTTMDLITDRTTMKPSFARSTNVRTVLLADQDPMEVVESHTYNFVWQ